MSKPKEKQPDSCEYSVPCTDPSMPEHKGQYFEIGIQGQLSDLWADWFEGLSIQNLENGDTLLSGYIVDQSALMGILNKLARLNLTLLSVNEIKNKEKK